MEERGGRKYVYLLHLNWDWKSISGLLPCLEHCSPGSHSTSSSLMPQGVPALWSSWLKCPGPRPGPSFSVTFSSWSYLIHLFFHVFAVHSCHQRMRSLRTWVPFTMLIIVFVGLRAAHCMYLWLTVWLIGRLDLTDCQDLKRQTIGEKISDFWKRPQKNLPISLQETRI